MTYKGTIQNRVAVLEDGAALPEGTEVRIEPMTGAAEAPTLAERFADVVGTAEGLPEDLAANHDHYLYGTPKAEPRSLF